MAKTVTVVVETGRDLYGCFIAEAEKLPFNIVGDGKSAAAAIEDFRLACSEMKASYEEEGREFPDLNFRFVFDVGAFFSYYPISITAFANYIGMNASLLRQYATGIKTPKGKSLEKIRQGVAKFKQDIDPVALIEKPVLQYI